MQQGHAVVHGETKRTTQKGTKQVPSVAGKQKEQPRGHQHAGQYAQKERGKQARSMQPEEEVGGHTRKHHGQRDQQMWPPQRLPSGRLQTEAAQGGPSISTDIR